MGCFSRLKSSTSPPIMRTLQKMPLIDKDNTFGKGVVAPPPISEISITHIHRSTTAAMLNVYLISLLDTTVVFYLFVSVCRIHFHVKDESGSSRSE